MSKKRNRIVSSSNKSNIKTTESRKYRTVHMVKKLLIPTLLIATFIIFVVIPDAVVFYVTYKVLPQSNEFKDAYSFFSFISASVVMQLFTSFFRRKLGESR